MWKIHHSHIIFLGGTMDFAHLWKVHPFLGCIESSFSQFPVIPCYPEVVNVNGRNVLNNISVTFEKGETQAARRRDGGTVAWRDAAAGDVDGSWLAIRTWIILRSGLGSNCVSLYILYIYIYIIYIYIYVFNYTYVYNYILCIALESEQLHWRTCIIEVFVTKKMVCSWFHINKASNPIIPRKWLLDSIWIPFFVPHEIFHFSIRDAPLDGEHQGEVGHRWAQWGGQEHTAQDHRSWVAGWCQDVVPHEHHGGWNLCVYFQGDIVLTLKYCNQIVCNRRSTIYRWFFALKQHSIYRVFPIATSDCRRVSGPEPPGQNV